jgi:sec-independent protein translocase protein TatA
LFGSIGGAEIVLVLLLALLLFGPRKIPQIGKTIGTALAEFRKATMDFKSNLEREVDIAEMKDLRNGIKSAGDDISDALQELRRPVRTESTPDGEKERES